MIEGPVACAHVAAGDAARTRTDETDPPPTECTEESVSFLTLNFKTVPPAASPPCHRVLLPALDSSVTAAGVIDGPVEIVSIKVCGP